ncbi:MAG: preprotein translocase subunit SecG [Candidatus Rokuibacteriota bacterium]
MFILVVTIHIIVSLVIVGLVLLQAGKGADIGSAFGGSGSQAVFGSMGTPTVLGKATAVVAAVFMITSFGLSIMSHRRAVSIMPASGPAAPATTPGAPAAVPTPSPAPQ